MCKAHSIVTHIKTVVTQHSQY